MECSVRHDFRLHPLPLYTHTLCSCTPTPPLAGWALHSTLLADLEVGLKPTLWKLFQSDPAMTNSATQVRFLRKVRKWSSDTRQDGFSPPSGTSTEMTG
ncbi:hypothetical protein Pelo_1419 [Pelomyxa schiedti]|nr:hypothetical protein Pelo_1419 [Pelomyxa schiedti]